MVASVTWLDRAGRGCVQLSPPLSSCPLSGDGKPSSTKEKHMKTQELCTRLVGRTILLAIAFLLMMNGSNAQTPGPWIKNYRNVMTGFYNMYNPKIIYEEGETYPYKMWFFGWASDVCNPIVGHGCDATFFARSQSLDGPWQVYSGCDTWDATGNPCLWYPVLTADGAGGIEGDSVHAGDPSVVKKDGVYYMVFSGEGYDADGIPNCAPGDTDNDQSVVLAAVSSDGIHWTVGSEPIIVQPSQLGAVGSGGASRPSLMWEVDHWRIWFDAPRPSDGNLSLYHAENYGDLLNPSDWVLTQDWDTPQQTNVPNPDVIKVGSTYYCFADPSGYTPAANPILSRQVGEYRSSDGFTWSFIGFIAPDPDTPADQIAEAYVEARDGVLWMYCWYAGTLPETSYSELSGDPCEPPVTPLEYTFDRIRYWRRVMDSAVAGNVAPLHNAVHVPLNVTLTWAAANNPAPTSHNVYFGTSTSPSYVGNTVGTTYSVGTLSYNTTYYWRIDEVGATTHTGTLWSFTTGPSGVPQQASELYPADHAMQVHVDRDMKWVAGFGATSHDVYFGTSSSPAFIGNQAGLTYDPGTLSTATRYYWRIDEKNGSGTTTGTVHSFITRGGSCPLDPAAGVAPASYSMDLGTYVSGNMASLTADDSNDFVVASTATGDFGRHARADFTFTGVASSSPSCIKVGVAVRSSISAMTYVVYLWNYTTSEWDQKHIATVGTAESSFEFLLGSSSSDYLSCGEMKVRTYGSHGSTAFNMTHDVIRIIAPPLDPAAGVVPTSYTSDFGTYVSGNMASLGVDDGNDFVLASTTSGDFGRNARADFTFSGIRTNSLDCIQLALTVRSSISAMTHAAYLWNYTTSAWDLKNLASVGMAETSVKFSVDGGSDDYLSCGEMKVRVYGSHASTAFNMTHDVIKIIVPPLDPAAGLIPDSYSVNLGTYVSGNRVSLAADDGCDFVLASNTTGDVGRHARADFVYSGITSGSSATIKVGFTVRSSISAMTYAVYLWNYTSSDWDLKNLASVGTTESTSEFTLGSSYADYLSGGEMRVRAYGAHASTSFTMTHDVLKVTVP
jgi:hypothetical protein